MTTTTEKNIFTLVRDFWKKGVDGIEPAVLSDLYELLETVHLELTNAFSAYETSLAKYHENLEAYEKKRENNPKAKAPKAPEQPSAIDRVLHSLLSLWLETKSDDGVLSFNPFLAYIDPTNKKPSLVQVTELKAQLAKKLQLIFKDYVIGRADMRNHHLQAMMVALNILIDAGNRNEYWDLCLVNSISISFRENNPFADPSSWVKATSYEKLNQAIHANLPALLVDDKRLVEVIKISLVIDSLIIHPKIYLSVIDQINIGKKLNEHKGLYYVNVETLGNSPERRVFISPLTRFYLDNLQQLGQQLIDKEPISHDFLTSLSLPISHYPKTIESWVRFGQYFILMDARAPALIVEYSKSALFSFSLISHRFEQLFVDNRIIALAQETDDSQFIEDYADKAAIRSYSRTWSMLINLLDVHHLEKRDVFIINSIQTQLDADFWQHALTENEYILLNFTKSLLQSNYLPARIKKILQNIGPKLIGLANSAQFNEMSVEIRKSLYDSCLELNDGPAHYYTLKRNLNIFENWLAERYSLEAISSADDFRDLPNVGGGYRVNALFITVDEFEHVKAKLLSKYRHYQQAYILLLLLILGFRLGLRRSEAAHLQLSDYRYDPFEPMLFIRETESRTLKTANARREFLLPAHMPESEWRLLNEHFLNGDRLKQIYFFSTNEKKSTTPMDITPHFTELMKIVRLVTDCELIDYHQLRHSKASLETLAAMEAQFDLKLGTLFFDDHPKTKDWLYEAPKRFALAVNENHYTKISYWLHDSMGHGSLSMTLGHYVHVMDMIIAGFIVKNAKEVMTGAFFETLHIMSERTYVQHKDHIIDYINQLNRSIKLANSALADKDRAQAQWRQKDRSQQTPTARLAKTQKKDATNSKLLLSSELNSYLPYQLQRVLHNPGLVEKFSSIHSEKLPPLYNWLADHTKLFFKEVKINAQQQLLAALKLFEQIYSVDLKSNQTPQINLTLTNLLTLFEKTLSVRYDKRAEDETSHHSLATVSQYFIHCTTPEQVTTLSNCMESLGFGVKCDLVCPKRKQHELEKIQQYWSSNLKQSINEIKYSSNTRKYGFIEVTALNDGKKSHVFYALMAMCQAWIVFTDMT